MLRAIILGPEKELAAALYTAATQCETFAVYGMYHEFPHFDQLIRIINHTDPNVILIEIDADMEAVVAMRDIRGTNPKIGLVGYADENAKDITPAEEYCEVIRSPFKPHVIQDAIVRAIEKNNSQRRDNVYAFLPAKAGNGATLTAMNVAGALTHYWKRKVLVVESDLHSGYLAVALRIEPKRTVVEALEESEELREDRWKGYVNSAHGVDWLLTARGNQIRRIAPWEYQQLLTFVNGMYDTIIVDLPEVVNEATEPVVRRAASVFIVTTTEVPALYLARRRMHDLKSRAVVADHRRIILNRFTGDDDAIGEYHEVLGHEISLTISNDYPEVQKAGAAGSLVSPDSALAQGYFRIAREIAGTDSIEPPPEEKSDKRISGMRRFFGGG